MRNDDSVLFRIFGVMLSCNVAAIAVGMAMRDARWIEYGNLAGSVAFGAWLGWKR